MQKNDHEHYEHYEPSDDEKKQLQQIADMMNVGYKPSEETVEKVMQEYIEAEVECGEGLGEIKAFFNHMYETAQSVFPGSRSFTKEEAKAYDEAFRKLWTPTGRKFEDFL